MKARDMLAILKLAENRGYLDLEVKMESEVNGVVEHVDLLDYEVTATEDSMYVLIKRVV